ncbi:MAG: UDP-N-acetylmuramate: L-alanyl-gamma-D-glutamyl-meso-diaminopimelate ligase [Arenicella sp.]|jgi:UDP-N-acetylmuramate: L-alanyl-gamma-D-glutamyl-meso-diaminopimelate ligase
MKIHIIGICGTFMGGVARLARDSGIEVSGSDANTYPPMSTQLESLGITLHEGYRTENLSLDVDIVLVGNSISRGNPELEYVLERGLAYTSGAQWLAENILQGRWVLAVAGTHGKTTTSSMLAWILEDNQLAPGYLIGGVPENFGESARLGNVKHSPFFVIEADEYDTAFCDKRSKFVHYRPRTLVLNNLEFDHADIFADLAAIQTQFNHLLRTVPSSGLVIHNQQSLPIDDVLSTANWSESASFGKPDSDWQVVQTKSDASQFTIIHNGQSYPLVWDLIGDHNMYNAVAAVAAAHHVGITIPYAVASLASFKSVKRRMELIYDDDQVRVFDDFAHHPTAITEALNGLRNSVGDETIIAVLEPRSNTMKRGIHKHLLADALQSANKSLIYADSHVLWDIAELDSEQIQSFDSTESLLKSLSEICQNTVKQSNSAAVNTRINIIIMSNGSFENLHQRLIKMIQD